MNHTHSEAIKVLARQAQTLDGMSEPQRNTVTQFTADQNKARAVELRASVQTLQEMADKDAEIATLKHERSVLQKINACRSDGLEAVGLHADCTLEEAVALAAEIAALKADLQDYMDAANAEAQEVNRLNGEIAALKAIVAAYIAYDESDYEDDVQMMLDYADMLKASRAAIAQAVQSVNQTKEQDEK